MIYQLIPALRVKDRENQVHKAILQSAVVHADETGSRQDSVGLYAFNTIALINIRLLLYPKDNTH
jgi:hypothetical protein